MTPAGRLAAAIDLLAEIEADPRPADAVANAFFRNRRFIGAGDQREVSGLVWGCAARPPASRLVAGSATTWPRHPGCCWRHRRISPA